MRILRCLVVRIVDCYFYRGKGLGKIGQVQRIRSAERRVSMVCESVCRHGGCQSRFALGTVFHTLALPILDLRNKTIRQDRCPPDPATTLRNQRRPRRLNRQRTWCCPCGNHSRPVRNAHSSVHWCSNSRWLLLSRERIGPERPSPAKFA